MQALAVEHRPFGIGRYCTEGQSSGIPGQGHRRGMEMERKAKGKKRRKRKAWSLEASNLGGRGKEKGKTEDRGAHSVCLETRKI